MVRGKRKSVELFRKSERVQGSRGRESAEGSENSVVVTRDGFFVFCFLFSKKISRCLVRVRVKDGKGEAEVSQCTLV